jgi:soluble P-type ATPase
MPSYVVETYVEEGDRERFAIDVAGIRSAVATMAVGDSVVQHVRSYIYPSDEMGFHVVVADSEETVARLAKAAGIDVERIVSAIGIDPREGAGDGG